MHQYRFALSQRVGEFEFKWSEGGQLSDGLLRINQFFFIWHYLLYITKILKRTRCTVKLVHSNHPRDPKLVTVVDKWSLFRGSFMLQKEKMGPKKGGRCWQVVVIRRWLLAQVWLCIKLKSRTQSAFCSVQCNASCLGFTLSLLGKWSNSNCIYEFYRFPPFSQPSIEIFFRKKLFFLFSQLFSSPKKT